MHIVADNKENIQTATFHSLSISFHRINNFYKIIIIFGWINFYGKLNLYSTNRFDWRSLDSQNRKTIFRFSFNQFSFFLIARVCRVVKSHQSSIYWLELKECSVCHMMIGNNDDDNRWGVYSIQISVQYKLWTFRSSAAQHKIRWLNKTNHPVIAFYSSINSRW